MKPNRIWIRLALGRGKAVAGSRIGADSPKVECGLDGGAVLAADRDAAAVVEFEHGGGEAAAKHGADPVDPDDRERWTSLGYNNVGQGFYYNPPRRCQMSLNVDIQGGRPRAGRGPTLRP
jgi:hypothetical protein